MVTSDVSNTRIWEMPSLSPDDVLMKESQSIPYDVYGTTRS